MSYWPRLRGVSTPASTTMARKTLAMALQRIEIPVQGMDCAGCCNTVQKALTALPGVQQADVLLAAEKAIVLYDVAQVNVPSLHRAVEEAGYTVPVDDEESTPKLDAAA